MESNSGNSQPIQYQLTDLQQLWYYIFLHLNNRFEMNSVYHDYKNKK